MKDYNDSEIVKAYAVAAGKQVSDLKDSNVGSNGYSLGQTFHTTGMRVVPRTDAVSAYIAVTTSEGTDLSLRSLMGVSSLKGYETSGKFISEFDEKKQKTSREISAEVIDGFDFGDVFQPSCRQFLSFAAECEDTNFWAGKTVEYLGNVVRPYEAKKDSPASSFEKYKAGYKRAMSARLWSVE